MASSRVWADYWSREIMTSSKQTWVREIIESYKKSPTERTLMTSSKQTWDSLTDGEFCDALTGKAEEHLRHTFYVTKELAKRADKFITDMANTLGELEHRAKELEAERDELQRQVDALKSRELYTTTWYHPFGPAAGGPAPTPGTTTTTTTTGVGHSSGYPSVGIRWEEPKK